MEMICNTQQRILTGLIVISAGVLLILALILLTASPAPAKPTINWTPSKVTETIAQGEEKTTVVSFTSKDDLTDVAVFVVPKLEPYVSANPSSFASISAGNMVTITLTMSASLDASLGTVDGTLHLRENGGSQATYAKPLPIVVNVWPVFESTDGEISLQHPGNLVVTEHETVNGSQSIDFLNSLTGEAFTIDIDDENPESLDLITWADQPQWPFPDDWRYHFVITSIGGLEALQDPITGSVILTKGTKIYYITNGIGQEPITLDATTFETILETFEILN